MNASVQLLLDWVRALAWLLPAACASVTYADDLSKLDNAIRKSIDFLAVEVRRWQPEQGCASCHNQGDAARALVAAQHAGLVDASRSLETTIAWSVQPGQWIRNRGLPDANDPTLSNLQFALTLLATHHHIRPALESVRQAALLVGDLQRSDGSWRNQGVGHFASPITYGPILLTGYATKLLKAADNSQFRDRIEHAQAWLRDQVPRNTLEASSLIIACHELGWQHPATEECVQILFKSQSKSGGVGPYVIAPDENYDTALALVAMRKLPPTDTTRKFQSQAVKFLLSMQNDEGDWAETTRPRGTESYAHRISTTGWVLQALIAYRTSQSAKNSPPSQ